MTSDYADYFETKPSTGYETPDLRLHAGRRDAVPAGRQHRGRLGGGAADPRRLGQGRGAAPLLRGRQPRPAEADTLLERDGRHWQKIV